MKYLITGGAGFIGSAVIRYIINHTQDEVLNIDKLTYAGNLESLIEVENNTRYSFQQIDICDTAALEQAIASFQPDIVMHLAAESHVDRSIDGPAAFIQTNIVGTYTLLEVIRKYWMALDSDKKQISVFIIFQQMKFMETWKEQPIYLQKPHLTRQVLHILRARQALIIWFVPGIEPMVYLRL